MRRTSTSEAIPHPTNVATKRVGGVAGGEPRDRKCVALASNDRWLSLALRDHLPVDFAGVPLSTILRARGSDRRPPGE